jgi:undecaprenyl-diphosphatase
MWERLIGLDRQLFELVYFRFPHPDWLNNLFIATDYLTFSGFIWIVLFFVFSLNNDPKKKKLAVIGLITLVTVSVVEGLILKNLFHRQRPFISLPEVELIGRQFRGYSFPSGHATSSVAIATLYYLFFPKTKLAYGLVFLACLTIFDRIYLGAHYPLDVLAGVMLGILFGWLFYQLTTRRDLTTKKSLPNR